MYINISSIVLSLKSPDCYEDTGQKEDNAVSNRMSKNQDYTHFKGHNNANGCRDQGWENVKNYPNKIKIDYKTNLSFYMK